MSDLRRFTLANGEEVYSVEGFESMSVVVYAERDGDNWKLSKGTLTNENISEYGLALKQIVNLGIVRTESEVQTVAEMVLVEDDLPEYDMEEIVDRISDAEDIQDMVD